MSDLIKSSEKLFSFFKNLHILVTPDNLILNNENFNNFKRISIRALERIELKISTLQIQCESQFVIEDIIIKLTDFTQNVFDCKYFTTSFEEKADIINRCIILIRSFLELTSSKEIFEVLKSQKYILSLLSNISNIFSNIVDLNKENEKLIKYILKKLNLSNFDIDNKESSFFNNNLASIDVTNKSIKPTSLNNTTKLDTTINHTSKPANINNGNNLLDSNKILLHKLDFNWVSITKSDEDIIFNTNMNLKFGDSIQLINSLSLFKNKLLADYPIEVFLQNNDIIISILKLLEKCNIKENGEILYELLNNFLEKIKLKLMCHHRKDSHDSFIYNLPFSNTTNKIDNKLKEDNYCSFNFVKHNNPSTDITEELSSNYFSIIDYLLFSIHSIINSFANDSNKIFLFSDLLEKSISLVEDILYIENNYMYKTLNINYYCLFKNNSDNLQYSKKVLNFIIEDCYRIVEHLNNQTINYDIISFISFKLINKFFEYIDDNNSFNNVKKLFFLSIDNFYNTNINYNIDEKNNKSNNPLTIFIDKFECKVNNSNNSLEEKYSCLYKDFKFYKLIKKSIFKSNSVNSILNKTTSSESNTLLNNCFEFDNIEDYKELINSFEDIIVSIIYYSLNNSSVCTSNNIGDNKSLDLLYNFPFIKIISDSLKFYKSSIIENISNNNEFIENICNVILLLVKAISYSKIIENNIYKSLLNNNYCNVFEFFNEDIIYNMFLYNLNKIHIELENKEEFNLNIHIELLIFIYDKIKYNFPNLFNSYRYVKIFNILFSILNEDNLNNSNYFSSKIQISEYYTNLVKNNIKNNYISNINSNDLDRFKYIVILNPNICNYVQLLFNKNKLIRSNAINYFKINMLSNIDSNLLENKSKIIEYNINSLKFKNFINNERLEKIYDCDHMCYLKTAESDFKNFVKEVFANYRGSNNDIDVFKLLDIIFNNNLDLKIKSSALDQIGLLFVNNLNEFNKDNTLISYIINLLNNKLFEINNDAFINYNMDNENEIDFIKITSKYINKDFLLFACSSLRIINYLLLFKFDRLFNDKSILKLLSLFYCNVLFFICNHPNLPYVQNFVQGVLVFLNLISFNLNVMINDNLNYQENCISISLSFYKFSFNIIDFNVEIDKYTAIINNFNKNYDNKNNFLISKFYPFYNLNNSNKKYTFKNYELFNSIIETLKLTKNYIKFDNNFIAYSNSQNGRFNLEKINNFNSLQSINNVINCKNEIKTNNSLDSYLLNKQLANASMLEYFTKKLNSIYSISNVNNFSNLNNNKKLDNSIDHKSINININSDITESYIDFYINSTSLFNYLLYYSKLSNLNILLVNADIKQEITNKYIEILNVVFYNLKEIAPVDSQSIYLISDILLSIKNYIEHKILYSINKNTFNYNDINCDIWKIDQFIIKNYFDIINSLSCFINNSKIFKEEFNNKDNNHNIEYGYLTIQIFQGLSIQYEIVNNYSINKVKEEFSVHNNNNKINELKENILNIVKQCINEYKGTTNILEIIKTFSGLLINNQFYFDDIKSCFCSLVYSCKTYIADSLIKLEIKENNISLSFILEVFDKLINNSFIILSTSNEEIFSITNSKINSYNNLESNSFNSVFYNCNVKKQLLIIFKYMLKFLNKTISSIIKHNNNNRFIINYSNSNADENKSYYINLYSNIKQLLINKSFTLINLINNNNSDISIFSVQLIIELVSDELIDKHNTLLSSLFEIIISNNSEISLLYRISTLRAILTILNSLKHSNNKLNINNDNNNNNRTLEIISVNTIVFDEGIIKLFINTTKKIINNYYILIQRILKEDISKIMDSNLSTYVILSINLVNTVINIDKNLNNNQNLYFSLLELCLDCKYEIINVQKMLNNVNNAHTNEVLKKSLYLNIIKYFHPILLNFIEIFNVYLSIYVKFKNNSSSDKEFIYIEKMNSLIIVILNSFLKCDEMLNILNNISKNSNKCLKLKHFIKTYKTFSVKIFNMYHFYLHKICNDNIFNKINNLSEVFELLTRLFLSINTNEDTIFICSYAKLLPYFCLNLKNSNTIIKNVVNLIDLNSDTILINFFNCFKILYSIETYQYNSSNTSNLNKTRKTYYLFEKNRDNLETLNIEKNVIIKGISSLFLISSKVKTSFLNSGLLEIFIDYVYYINNIINKYLFSVNNPHNKNDYNKLNTTIKSNSSLNNCSNKSFLNNLKELDQLEIGFYIKKYVIILNMFQNLFYCMNENTALICININLNEPTNISVNNNSSKINTINQNSFIDNSNNANILYNLECPSELLSLLINIYTTCNSHPDLYEAYLLILINVSSSNNMIKKSFIVNNFKNNKILLNPNFETNLNSNINLLSLLLERIFYSMTITAFNKQGKLIDNKNVTNFSIISDRKKDNLFNNLNSLDMEEMNMYKNNNDLYIKLLNSLLSNKQIALYANKTKLLDEIKNKFNFVINNVKLFKQNKNNINDSNNNLNNVIYLLQILVSSSFDYETSKKIISKDLIEVLNNIILTFSYNKNNSNKIYEEIRYLCLFVYRNMCFNNNTKVNFTRNESILGTILALLSQYEDNGLKVNYIISNMIWALLYNNQLVRLIKLLF